MSYFTGHVYKITNMANSKIYVGQTKTTLNKRFTSHKCESKRERYINKLYEEMREFGTENFEIESLSEIKTNTKDELSNMLNILEKEYIERLNPEYNAAPGGLGHTGVPRTEERRENFKSRMSGENNPNFGKPLSDVTKEKLSKALKGRVISEESRKSRSLKMKGVAKSEETREKMKEAAKNRTNNPPAGKDHTRSKSVDQYDTEGNFIRTYDSIGQAAKELSIQVNGICLCCQGKLKKSGGFVWKYHSEVDIST